MTERCWLCLLSKFFFPTKRKKSREKLMQRSRVAGLASLNTGGGSSAAGQDGDLGCCWYLQPLVPEVSCSRYLWSCCLLILMKEKKIILIPVLQNWFWVTPSHKWLSRQRWAQSSLEQQGSSSTLGHRSLSHMDKLLRTTLRWGPWCKSGKNLWRARENCLFRSEIEFCVTGLSMSYSRAKQMSLGSAAPVQLVVMFQWVAQLLTSRLLPNQRCFVKKSPGSHNSDSTLWTTYYGYLLCHQSSHEQLVVSPRCVSWRSLDKSPCGEIEISQKLLHLGAWLDMVQACAEQMAFQTSLIWRPEPVFLKDALFSTTHMAWEKSRESFQLYYCF